ncbi:ABC transporter ATP-binding protein [Hazenella sp. IB182357]|uniref:Carnitine transport ATP-binding protein OpuCA n=1 Tax=Polycladospora coralii TaxID=2771432 RepID=A0A926NAW7_9BACL|nr:ABC transporter ATP-binding protein [Polycladospora coralii]MBS7531734.1 ABC transporter ATP-binding protein [Polycladospora coralii]
MLHLTNIQKTYPHFHIHVPELHVLKGEFLALLGSSGSGKSTLLRIIAGLLTPEQGTLVLDHQTLTHIKPEKRDIAMAFQQPLLFPHLNVIENISFGLKMKRRKKKERLQQATSYLELVGLEGYETRMPHQLSGGEQQRVSLARAMIMKPRLLLMDEPFSSVDPNIRSELQELTLRLHAEHHMTTIFVTHDHDEAFQMADRIGIMQAGKLLQVDTAHQLYQAPLSVDVARFLGQKNIWQGFIQAGKFISDFITFDRVEHPTGKGHLIAPPSGFQLLKPTNQKSEHEMEGTIAKISVQKGSYRILVRVHAAQIETTVPFDPHITWTPNEPVLLRYQADHFTWLPDPLA